MSEHQLRDLNGQSIGTVMWDVDDPSDQNRIKYAIRKRIPNVDSFIIRKMRDDKPPHADVCAVAAGVFCRDVIHYFTGKLPAQFYARDLLNLIDRWDEERKTIIREEALGNTIYTKAEYESVMGQTIGRSPIEVF